jgi:hypothetical protein
MKPGLTSRPAAALLQVGLQEERRLGKPPAIDASLAAPAEGGGVGGEGGHT